MSHPFVASTRRERARTTHTVNCPTTSRIVSHRLNKSQEEEYLLIWQDDAQFSGVTTVASWHALAELDPCVLLVQKYIESNASFATASSASLTTWTTSRKRKAPGADDHVLLSRDDSGLLTPIDRDAISFSRSESPLSVPNFESSKDEPKVYNGILQKREGRIVAIPSQHHSVPDIDIATLPTRDMLAVARNTPVSQAEEFIWKAFARKLKDHSKATHTETRIENRVDRSTPSLAFEFIQDLVLGDGTYTMDPEAVVGCKDPCRPDMGGKCGCEYTKKCACLEFAAVDEQALKREPERYESYRRQQESGENIDTAGLPKQFPYTKPKEDRQVAVTLRKHYRETRNVIYECNASCNCGPICKSRLVQNGRRVPLTIFKTANRGWGVYCNEDLVVGEFIDTYLGEVITTPEADRREAAAGTQNKSSYMYALDKFVGDGDVTEENCFVVDGQHMGGPTRFINHSCEPNCRQYVVSYNKYDLRVYDLAFFAYENIPKGTELTFDYLDEDELEEEELQKLRDARANDAKYTIKIPCNCGSQRCRGTLW